MSDEENEVDELYSIEFFITNNNDVALTFTATGTLTEYTQVIKTTRTIEAHSTDTIALSPTFIPESFKSLTEPTIASYHITLDIQYDYTSTNLIDTTPTGLILQ